MKLDELKLNPEMKKLFGEVEKKIVELKDLPKDMQKEGFFNIAKYLKEKRQELQKEGNFDYEQYKTGSNYIISII